MNSRIFGSIIVMGLKIARKKISRQHHELFNMKNYSKVVRHRSALRLIVIGKGVVAWLSFMKITASKELYSLTCEI